MFSSQFCQRAAEPVDEQQRRAVAAGVDDVQHLTADVHASRVSDGQSTRLPRAVVAVAVRVVRARSQEPVLDGRDDLLTPIRHGPTTVSTRLRIAIDIDSTLHHYWDQFAAAAKRRFGVDLPYRDQMWRIEALRPEQVQACVEETHRDEQILAAEPYPGAVETIAAWHEAGHFIHVTTHRRADAHSATQQWLDRIGLAYDDLYCSGDKLARAKEIGIELMIDDSPGEPPGRGRGRHRAPPRSPTRGTARSARRRTSSAPADWPELARRLAPLLDDDRRMSERPAPCRRPSDALQAQLPAIEPERQVTDWGRSERVEGAMDRRSTTGSTTTGSAARSRGSSTSPTSAARCSSPTTPARCRPTRR